jgi:hypothetical protein
MALNRNMEERLSFVRFWVNYMRTHSNKEWSRQQTMLINSMLKSANKDPVLYMKVKRIVAEGSKTKR